MGSTVNNLEYKKDILYASLKKNIQSGLYAPGYQFPKELDLAKLLNVAKVTIRSALAMLRKDGLIARIRGKGTFVISEETNRGDIVVVVDNINECASPYIYILEGIKSAAVHRGINVRICERYYIESFTGKEFAKSVVDNKISGILTLGAYYTGKEKLIRILTHSNVPVVIPHATGNSYFTTGFACIQIDMRMAWEDAMRHLRENGHRRIATIALRKNPDIRGLRSEEHFELLKKYGADTDRHLFNAISYDKESIFRSVNDWMKLQVPPTAILCFSDFFAIHVYDALKQLNLKIPEHVAVMGCCGYPGAGLMTPPLSTSDFRYQEQGESALELIMKSDTWFPGELKMAKPRIIMSHTLVKRESTNIKIMENMEV